MQAEVAVQVDHVLLRHGDARPLAVVQGIAMRHDHVEPVHGAALEQTNQDRTAIGGSGRRGAVGREGRPSQEQRIQADAEECQPARLHEDPS